MKKTLKSEEALMRRKVKRLEKKGFEGKLKKYVGGEKFIETIDRIAEVLYPYYVSYWNEVINKTDTSVRDRVPFFLYGLSIFYPEIFSTAIHFLLAYRIYKKLVKLTKETRDPLLEYVMHRLDESLVLKLNDALKNFGDGRVYSYDEFFKYFDKLEQTLISWLLNKPFVAVYGDRGESKVLYLPEPYYSRVKDLCTEHFGEYICTTTVDVSNEVPLDDILMIVLDDIIESYGKIEFVPKKGSLLDKIKVLSVVSLDNEFLFSRKKINEILEGIKKNGYKIFSDGREFLGFFPIDPENFVMEVERGGRK